MNFQTYFLFSSFAFILSGFLALVLTGRLDPISATLYLAATVVAWRFERHTPEKLIQRKTANLLSGLGLPLAFLDALFLVANPFFAISHFALYLSAIKLMQRKNDSDWVWLYTLAFFEVLLSAALTIDATFLVSVGLFLFCFIAVLGAFEIKRSHTQLERVEEEDHAMRGSRARPLRRVLFLNSMAGSQLVLIAIIAVPIFFLMPRFSGGKLGSTWSPTQTLSGFSNTVNLGDIERIKENQTVVMHVKLNRDPGRYVRWRGVALENFDGTTWRSQARIVQAFSFTPNPGSARFCALPQLARTDLLSEMLEQTIFIEPIDAETMFAASRVKAIDEAPRLVRIDSTDSLFGPRHDGVRLSYTAYSDVSTPSPNELLADTLTTYPERVARIDLQLPKIDDRVGLMAREIVGDAATPYEKARRIESYLRTQFSYTLDLTRSDTSIDPVSDFLLNVRQGHCEYFASGMVVMLRKLGVPARIVNGFQMGEYNAMSGAYTVRQSDAHSWVEVYFAGSGQWVEFDPTPASGLNSYSFGPWAQMRQAVEALQLVWIQYVVSLDDREQISMLRGLRDQIAELRVWFTARKNEVRNWIAAQIAGSMQTGVITPRRVFGVLVIGMMIGAMAFVAFVMHGNGWSLGGFVLPVWRLRRFWGRQDHAAERTAVLFYEQMSFVLSRYGIVRDPSQTPREFARATGYDEVVTITELYQRVRFGGVTDTAIERQVAIAMSGLASRLRSRKPSRPIKKPKAEAGSG